MPKLIIRKKSCNYRIVPFTDNLSIGRDSDNELVLDSPQISRHHAKIEQRKKGFYLTDCESTNGIWLGKEKIRSCRLENGLTFKIFDYFFTFTSDKLSSHVRMDRQQHAQGEKTIVFGLESFLPETSENIEDTPSANRLPADLLTDMHRLEQIDSEPDLYDNLLLCAVRFYMYGSGFMATRDRDGELIYRSTHNLTPSGTEVVADQNLISLVLDTGKIVGHHHLNDVKGATKEQQENTATFVLCAPLRCNDRIEGCLYLSGETKTEYPPEILTAAIEILSLYGSSLLERIRCRVRANLKHQRLQNNLEKKSQTIVRSKSMIRLYEDIKTIAPINVPVLILGEAGTGKELVASALHEFSDRKGAYVPLNCSAIPEGIFESELFGSTKGAFHNAGNKPGKLELAHNGTIFLDEIGDMELVLQPKLLRFLENREITRLGDTRVKTLDTRVVAATNRNLEEKIQQQLFREDLFQRLSCFILHIPPLRERREDIEPLVHHFLQYFAGEYNWQIPTLTGQVMKKLEYSPWPGNIRELKNTILRLSVQARGKTITVDDLVRINKNFDRDPGQKVSPAPNLEEMERKYLRQTLETTGWNISEAAKIAGIARSTFYQKMKKYTLSSPA